MYRPRLPFSRLRDHHGDARGALAAGDFLSAIAMGEGDPDIMVPALVMAGNERAGLRRAATATGIPAPLTLLTAALGAWLAGDDRHAAERRAELAASAPRHAGNHLLDAVFGTTVENFIYYCSSSTPDGFADYLKRWFGPQVTVIGHNPSQVDICIGIDTPAAALRAALAQTPAFVLINQLIVLPRAILELPCPKIGYSADIEFYWAARGADLDALDCIVTGNSSDLLELGLRTRAPLLQRTAALPQTFDAPLRIDRAPHARAIDVVTTGSIDSAFFPEKQIRFLAAASLPARYAVELRGQVLSRDDYQALLTRSKYMLTSCRSTHAVLGRQIEAILAGAIALVPEHSGLPLLLDTPHNGVVEYPTEQSNAGIAAALAGYERNHAAFLAHAESLETALEDAYPSGGAGARRLVRYLHLVAAMTRAGLSWPALCEGRARPEDAVPRAAPAGCSVARFVHLTPYREPHRGTLLRSAVQAARANPLDIPFATELAAATAFESISNVGAHLIRLLDMGRAKVRGRVMQILNAARKRNPQCLATWFQLGEFLYARRRFAAAERVFTHMIGSDLVLGDRPYIIDPANEFSDFPFVDTLIRDHLEHLETPSTADTGGPPQRSARILLLARVQAMQAHIDAATDRPQAARERLENALREARYDVPVHEMYLLLARVLAKQTGDMGVMRRMIVVYALMARRAVHFSYLYFPLVLNVATAMRRDRLVELMLRRWLRFRARLLFRPGALVLNEDEAGALAPHAILVERLIAGWAGTPLQPVLLPILGQLRRNAVAA